MSDSMTWVAQTYDALADLLGAAEPGAWDAASLCEGWRVRHVVAHVTMPTRLTPERFATEMAAAGGDFTTLSNNVAEHDSALPVAELLGALRSSQLHDWVPPGGGESGAVSHAVIHSLDITVALDAPDAAPRPAELSVLDQLAERRGSTFGVDLDGLALAASDADWTSGDGTPVDDTAGRLVSLLSGRTLPDGRSLPRRG